jgi:4-hydroxy-2-oxoheptanedioate aldolase
VRIEDKYALANAEKVTAVPGIGFAELGPGDMGLSLGFLENHDPPYPPAMAAARARGVASSPIGKCRIRWLVNA